jgi:hypothetical protein
MIIVPYVTTPWMTYGLLCMLIVAHLVINYFGIRGVALRTFNRQRLGIAWTVYRGPRAAIPSPAEVSALERLFARPSALHDARTGAMIGRCVMGASITGLVRQPHCEAVCTVFARERFVVWLSETCADAVRRRVTGEAYTRVHVSLKEGHGAMDHVKAWAVALEAARLVVESLGREDDDRHDDGEDEVTRLLRRAYTVVDARFPEFVAGAREGTWNVEESTMLGGPPDVVLVSVREEASGWASKKEKKEL